MIYYLGPEGSYSHEAALLLDEDAIAVKSIKEVFQNSRNGRGIVPWENSIEGSVGETLDLLLESEVHVVGEVNLQISHCLLGYENETNRIVYSHPQAIGQCREYLERNNLEPIPVSSTAYGVLEAKKKRALAIGSLQAAKVYGIPILEKGIQDRRDNSTRFAVLGSEGSEPTGRDKTSIIFSTLNDKPGVLYRVLAIFADYGINLTRIESRPTKRYLGEYLFHIDCDGHRKDSVVSAALSKVKEQTSFLKILGSYPKWQG